MHGDVVSDFCHEIGISLPKDKHVKFNTAMPLELTSLIFAYNSYCTKVGRSPLSTKRLVELQNKYAFDGEFRLAPDLILPVIERNSEDIAWMEKRISDSLKESVPSPGDEDIFSAADLLKNHPELARKMRKELGKAAPCIGCTAEGSPEDLIRLLQALNKRDARNLKISKLRIKARKLLEF